ncbi:hypothetical protein GMORB2_6079 [Geosmithia morbida]|uniref:Uncharacterized protein n=1 Tax=Geosmithia morbida TaxID=1094350 RepID=A0A9P5D123_9HYPO|nr:uncharacterized protein GMORB2_6079 [Geosmithia morbida]KAF4123378.1 hypothetical protein GMORB2_6079 [Geosmithia morbida]
MTTHVQVRASDNVPSAEKLQEIQEHSVLDHRGGSHTLRSIWNGEKATSRVLIIFIRHFYCGLCQDYVQTLSESITPESLPADASVVIIGCGDPGLIDGYAGPMGCRFPIYADPSRRAFAALGLVETLDAGTVAPAYQKRSIAQQAFAGFLRAIGSIPRGLAHKGGDMRQVGGEFLFQDGAVKWCHRMTTTRDHTEVPELMDLLGLS